MDTSALPAPLAAALLDAGYRVGGPAGVGGGGPVWTATRVTADHPAPERVVVQVLDVSDAATRARLAGRLEALWALDHPHLPTVVDVVVMPGGDAGGEMWAVLLAEVPGATVAALLAARGRLSTAEVVTLTVPIAGALDGLHRSGLVHGDVSPANVVVRPDGRPVLIDVLGEVHVVPAGAAGDGRSGGGGASGARQGRRGTPGFIAPELSGASPAPTGRPGRQGPPTVSGAAEGGPAAGAAPGGLAAGAPADVFALAGVALAALDLAEHGGRLGDELRAASAWEPIRRPTAAELAAAVYACAEPAPIVQPDAGVLARTALAQLAAPARTVSVPTGGRHRARRPRRSGGPWVPVRRRWLVAGALVTAGAVPGVAWAVLSGPAPATEPTTRVVASGPEPGPTTSAATATATAGPAAPAAPPDEPATAGASPVPPAVSTPVGRRPDRVDAAAAELPDRVDPAGVERPDPVDAAVALTRQRADALAAGDVAGLAAVTSPGSPAHRADRSLLGRLTADGVTLDGLAVVVEEAALVLPAAPGTGGTPGTQARSDDGTDEGAAVVTDVRVRSSLTAHTRRSPSGDVEVPAQPARDVVLRLAWTDAGWRVTDVGPA